MSAHSFTVALASKFASFKTQVRDHPTIALATIASISVLPFVSVLPYVWKTYGLWLSLEPGGVPRNFFGWMVQCIFQLAASRDTTDLSPFSRPQIIAKHKPHGRSSFLEPGYTLPFRAGNRPTVPGFTVPQRQTTQKGTEQMLIRTAAHLSAIVTSNQGLLTLQPSKLEGGAGPPALWLENKTRCPTFMARTNGELVHIHDDGSSHMTLSLADAEEVVHKGWGERHRLSGVVGISWGYVMVYAPRDEGEFEVWKRLVYACLRYVHGDGPVITKA